MFVVSFDINPGLIIQYMDVCFVQAGVDFYSVIHVYHDLKRNVGISQIYCSCMSALHMRGKHLRHHSSSCKTFKALKHFFYRRGQMPHTLQRGIVI